MLCLVYTRIRALTSVGGSILSVTHADITSFDGLSQLSGGAGLQVSIRNNGLLQDFDGLAGLTTPASMILTGTSRDFFGVWSVDLC